MAKKKIKKHRRSMFPVIGKYFDTPTKSTFKVVYFMDDVGFYKLIVGNLPPILLKNCRFQLLASDMKTKKKFYKKIKPLLEFSLGWKELENPPVPEMPLLFGLLKLRKGKKRLFVLIRSVDAFFKSRVVNVAACEIDNLLYLDLIDRVKEIS